MPDDFRARISKLGRDIDRAVEIGDSPAPENGSILFDWDGFVRLWGYDGPVLSNSDMPRVESSEMGGPIQSKVPFDFGGFASMNAIHQEFLRREQGEPPAPAMPTAPDPPPALPESTEPGPVDAGPVLNELLNLAPTIVTGAEIE